MDTQQGSRADERIVPMRLQKFLARAGASSRRGSENLMTAGRVTVNGQVVTELGSKVDPACDVVAVDGHVVSWGASPTTIMLHKPAGFVTTMSDPHGRATVADLVPTDRYPGLYPIGRLDADTTGLLLFSTDGELGHGLLHPRHHVEKTYWALVEGRPGPADVRALCDGVLLEDGRTAPARARVLAGAERDRAMACFAGPRPHTHAQARQRTRAHKGRDASDSVVELVLTEGRKHQVKRMLAAVGHPVVSLHRETFGPLSLAGLARGTWRELSVRETEALHRAVGGA